MSTESLARPPAPITPEQYVYPHPLQLARARAERIETHAAYGEIGGLTTFLRHGREHYRRMALRRWSR